MRNQQLSPQSYHIRLQYSYYDVFSQNHISETFTHQVNYDKISECLARKNYILRKSDILQLLKEDGAQFAENSLRIWKPAEGNFFLVTDNWKQEVYQNLDLSLYFCIKSTSSQIKDKLDDIAFELQSVKETMQTYIVNTKEELKNKFEKFEKEIDKLNKLNNVVFNQLSKKSAVGPIPVPKPVEPAPITEIALMYSEPLVKYQGQNPISVGDPVDYESECNKLLDVFKNQKKKINVYFELANFENFVKMVLTGPRILHIICHGNFSKENNQFYLCFEEKGRLKEVYSDDIKDVLKEVSLKTQVIFVNACHSEAVAKVFQDAGATCVIAVQSELKIADHVAQDFSKNFYWNLFRGTSIREAFNLARIAMRGQDIYTCCCAHEHAPDCKWQKLAKRNLEEAHYKHTPTCTQCKHKNKFLHNSECKWAIDFVFEFCTKKSHVPGGMIFACCCAPELPHNEVMKFKCLCSDTALLDRPFQSREGEMVCESISSCVNQRFPMKRISGRNRELYEIYSAFAEKDKKFVNLYGIEGIGKTTLVKQAANYLFERKIFNKISIVTLRRVANIVDFRSELFKQVPNAYDIEAFCEALQRDNALLILENADLVVKQELELFRKDLYSIADAAPNVKFIIMTNEPAELNLIGLQPVNMGLITKLDAAKMLYETSFPYLKTSERDIYKLQSHRIFTLVPRTPPGIWFITEKLRHGRQLEEIEQELANEREEAKENQIQDPNGAIRILLEEIKIDREAYSLLLLLSIFPSGLSYQDLEEMKVQDKVTRDWKEILLGSLTLRVEYDLYGETPEGPSDTTPGGTPGMACLNADSFPEGNYLGITISRDPEDNKVTFVPSQFLTRYVESSLIDDLMSQNLKKLEYMTSLSLALIDQLKVINAYQEKLVEFSLISDYGLWKIGRGMLSDVYANRGSFGYIKQMNTLEELKACFDMHEANFICCVDPKIVNDILQVNPNSQAYISEIIEILYLSVPTLFKVMSNRYTEAKELAIRASRILEFVGEGSSLKTLEVKINLFLLGLNLDRKDKSEGNLRTIKVQLELLTKLQGEIEDEGIKNAVIAEISFAKAVFASKKDKSSSYEDFQYTLQTAGSHLTKERSFEVCRAKIVLLEVKAKEHYNKDIKDEALEELESAREILEIYGAQKLLMETYYWLGRLKAEMEKRNMNIKAHTDPHAYVNDVSQRLLEIKEEYLVENALRIAGQIKNHHYGQKIKRAIEKIDQEIKLCFFNFIVLMKASPIVAYPEHNLHHVQPIGYPTRLPSKFKDNVIEMLDRHDKTLYIKFETLTIQNLSNCVQNGCRVLQLSSDITEEGSLCIEGDHSELQKLSDNDIYQLFTPKTTAQQCIDVLILAIKNDLKLAQIFEKMKIPHIITFKFENTPDDHRQKVYEEKYIEQFCMLFYGELVMQKSVMEAFEAANQKALNYLGKAYFEGSVGKSVQGIIGGGAILLPEANRHNEIVFNNSEFRLSEGILENISPACPHNFAGLNFPFTGRKQDLYNVSEYIRKNRNFLSIDGGSGVGKTAFVVELGHHLVSRNAFVDGVYYVPFKNFQPYEDVKDVLREAIGPQIGTVISDFFENKDMLLIFDDFDVFNNPILSFPKNVLNSLKECGIACIFVTNNSKVVITDDLEREECKSPDLQMDYLEMMQGLSEYLLEPLDVTEIAHLILSLVDFSQGPVSIRALESNDEILNAEGLPTDAIRSLISRTIQVDNRLLDINPEYKDILRSESVLKKLSHSHSIIIDQKSSINKLQSYQSEISGFAGYDNKGKIRADSGDNVSFYRGHIKSMSLGFSPFQGADRESLSRYVEVRAGSRGSLDDPQVMKRLSERSYEQEAGSPFSPNRAMFDMKVVLNESELFDLKEEKISIMDLVKNESGKSDDNPRNRKEKH